MRKRVPPTANKHRWHFCTDDVFIPCLCEDRSTKSTGGSTFPWSDSRLDRSTLYYEGLGWEGMWLFLDTWDVVGLRTTASVWNVTKKYGPLVEAYLLLYQEGANKPRENCGI